MAIPILYIVLLSLLFFLFYWIVGGAFFAVIAVFRLGRLKKGRFSCLFSLFSLIAAVGAAYLGLTWGLESTEGCMDHALTGVESFVAFFGCSVVSMMTSFVVGAVAVLIFGAVSMAFSSARSSEPKPKKRKKKENRGHSVLE